VKDNIDLAGLPTTAACPAFAYAPETSATVVERLLAAGAVAVGKTNLDQFATGLVGTRSPHGAPACVFNRDYISGGSSSGSAVAVAAGLVDFALGTDTAGSGRVPAAFNGLVGFKPSKGRWSTTGLVPACRSLDCISVFTLDAALALRIDGVLAAFDPVRPGTRPCRPGPDTAFPGRTSSTSSGMRSPPPSTGPPWTGWMATASKSISRPCWTPPGFSTPAPSSPSARRR
jgi:allophanate hydrolase